jgi:hypothetical protein
MQLFKGIDYLKIDLANSMGLDKKTWNERLAWYEDHKDNLIGQLKEAENPAQYFAGYEAMELVRMGKGNSGYLISLDATSSGIQILSALTGDRLAAELCNVIDTGRRRDAYTDLFVSMKGRITSNASIIRDDLKNAIMTAFYGSEAVPKRVFGEGTLLMAFYNTLEVETPYVWALNKAFLKMWNPSAYEYKWVMPDNFHVVIKVNDKVQETITFMGDAYTTEKTVNQPTPGGRSIGANITHSIDGFIVREMGRRCMFNPKQKAYVQQLIVDGSSKRPETPEDDSMVNILWNHYRRCGILSARILNHMNGTNIHMVDTDVVQDLLDSMPARPFDVLGVHDCFKCHPNYGNDLRKQYNLQLSNIADSTLLSYLLTQLLGSHTPVNKKGNFAKEVLNANYALS